MSNHSGGRRRRGTSNDLNYAYRRVSGWQITRGATWKCRIAPTPSTDPAADRRVQYFPDRAGMHERIAGQRTREFVLNSSMRSARHIEKLNKKPSKLTPAAMMRPGINILTPSHDRPAAPRWKSGK
ncbi:MULTISPECIES: hypothetical protein [unclassified Burkholderia]|uniref:hypothetical protein n=1 Tax=unclassified Burkholderia TaxID=2613784 RepID=UPI00158D5A56|nr:MULTISPECIES: hypothetical protein [unclassified Burkholderia]